MDNVTIQRLEHLEKMTDWLVNIPNPYNRVRMVSDEQLIKLIDEKLTIYESEYD